MEPSHTISQYLPINRQSYQSYFDGEAENIARHNLRLICLLGLSAAVLIAAVYTITVIFFPEQNSSPLYVLFIAVMLGFVLLSQRLRRQTQVSPRLVQWISTVFLLVLGFYLVTLSVFPHSDEPEVYVSLYVVILPTIMILTYAQYLVNLVFIVGSFVTLCIRVKSADVVDHDVFIVAIAAAMSLVNMMVITSLRCADNREMRHFRTLSNTDQLTGVTSKGACEQMCRSYLSQRGAEERCAMMIVDMDDFKNVNDTLGHQCGDELLRHVGGVLASQFRSGDVIGRIGGDEFLVLLRNMSDEAVLERKSDTIRREMQAAFQQYPTVKTTCSIGIAISPENFISYEELFALADAALYHAKQAGKSSHSIFHATQTISAQGERNIMLVADDSAAARAILRSTFEADYQILEAEDGVQAIQMITQYGSKLAVVLLDLIMPKADGYAVLEYTAARPQYAAIPILVTTADAEHEERALRMGAADLIAKPFDPQVLRLRMANAVRRR